MLMQILGIPFLFRIKRVSPSHVWKDPKYSNQSYGFLCYKMGYIAILITLNTAGGGGGGGGGKSTYANISSRGGGGKSAYANANIRSNIFIQI